MAQERSLSLIRLDTVDSTNSYLSKTFAEDDLPHGTIVSSRIQSAGRGQRGNKWEAAPGRNVTMSMLLRPVNIAPREQFMLSEIVSVAIVMTLRRYITNSPVSIKWPNDIYVGDRKICGILIEHSLGASRIDHSIVGIGLNVNQDLFVSDAPNPVSMIQLTGEEYDIDDLTIEIGTSIMKLMDRYDNPHLYSEIHDIYRSMMWRRDVPSPYHEPSSGERFIAVIRDVDPDGHLHLLDTHGRDRSYAFKEVAFLL